MANRRRNLFVLLFVAGLILASALVVMKKSTKLGLDLRGGTELVYEGRPTPQTPEVKPEDVDRAIEIIRDRVDSLGVAEPEISRIGQTSVLVGLPDVQNADRAIDRVGTTAQLYFYDWEPNVIDRPEVNDGDEDGFPRLYDAVIHASKQKTECMECTSGPQYYLFDAQSHERLGGTEDEQGDPSPAGEEKKEDLFANLPGERQPPNSEVLVVPQGVVVLTDQPSPDDPATETNESERAAKEYFVLRDRPQLTGTDIKDPKQDFDPTTNQPNVTFDFTDDGRQQFQEVTREIAQRGLEQHLPGNPPDADSDHFAVVLDQEVKSRPIINFQENPDGIDGRTGAQISGGFQLQEAQDIAEVLRIGALPIKLQLISQTTVSASLGQEALDQGLKAGIVGLILVLLFLIAYYRFLGVVAAVGLLVYALFFFALVKLIPITLTLPGIAGLILTIGVAADSNIIIFERIREEVWSGKSIPSAIANGYRKGIATIIDANVITLITAFILFVLATAGVKGFAFTLGVGTIVSLFTAVVFTQAFLGLFGRSRVLRSPQLIGTGEQRVRWHFDFTGASKWFFSMSGLILMVGAIAFATLQLNLGIDFESGTRIKAGLAEDAAVEDVRTTLDGTGAADAEVQSVEDPELGENVIQIATSQLPPDQVGQVQTALDNQFGLVENGFDNQSIGPTFGEQVARSAAYAIFFSLLVICAYVAFRFEAKYAVPVMIALFHDILITGGVYSLSGREVTSGTVAAFLTILGYSLYDTVIVFDRIRENVPRLPRAAFSQIVNRSMSEVLTRSLITGLSTVFLVTVLLIFGGTTLKDFAFAMMVGIASGTYSSIFIASPVLTAWKDREPDWRRRRERIEDQMGYLPAFPEENVIARIEEEPGGDGGAAPPPVQPPQPPGQPQPIQPPQRQDPVAQPPATPPAAPQQPQPPGRPGDGAEGGDGQDAGDGAPGQPVEAGVSKREQKRRRQQRRKRKHGRHR